MDQRIMTRALLAVPMPMNRDLFLTLEMLRAEGLNASLRLRQSGVCVRLDHHVAEFQSPNELRAAANWLAECTLKHYPESEFSKLWLWLLNAAAAQAASDDGE